MIELVAPSCKNGGFIHRLLDLWRSGKVLRSTTGQVALLEKSPLFCQTHEQGRRFCCKIPPCSGVYLQAGIMPVMSWKLHDPKKHKFSLLDFHDDNMPIIVTEQKCEGVFDQIKHFQKVFLGW